MPLADLPDDAYVQIVALDPPPADAGEIVAALDKLLRQLAREGRIAAWAVEAAAGGAALVIAWHGAEDLSGCSKDKLAQVLADRERRGGVAILSAPPLLVELAGGARAVDRATLRRLIADGAVDAATPVYDRRVRRLGEWRAHGRVALGASWLAELVGR
ncbi:MAG TPA: hypothetical protein VEL07_00135 [Planctomycetota bacterium]|nr:hypothetical protein [Planctomycetota bacterium]